MKLTHLTGINLRVLWQKKRLFCIAMLLLQCIAVLILLFGTAAVQNTLAFEKEVDERARYFDVDLRHYSETETEIELAGYYTTGSITEPIYEETPKLILDYALPLSDMIATCETILEETTWIQPESIWFTAKSGSYKVRIVYNSADSPLTQDSRPLVRLNATCFPDYKAGDIFSYQNNDYIVESVSSNYVGDITVSAVYAPKDCICYEMRMDFPEWPTTKQAEEFSNLLSQYFVYNTMHVPETVDPLTAQFNAVTLLMCAVMMAAVIINLCYAQMYVYQLRKPTLAIYRLCGAGRKEVISNCITETECIALICYACSAAVFHFLLEDVVAAWYPIADGMYTLKFYCLFGVVYLLFFYFLLLPPLLRLVRNEIITIKQEGTI